jgi:hypothetical protein
VLPVPDLTDEIETTAQGASQFTTDGQSATAHNLKDLIEADKYLKETGAADTGPVKSGWGRVRMARAIPPGAGPSG